MGPPGALTWPSPLQSPWASQGQAPLHPAGSLSAVQEPAEPETTVIHRLKITAWIPSHLHTLGPSVVLSPAGQAQEFTATDLRWGDRQVRSTLGTWSNSLASLLGPTRRQQARGPEAVSGMDFNSSPAIAPRGRPERVCPSRLAGEVKPWLLAWQPVLRTPGAGPHPPACRTRSAT